MLAIVLQVLLEQEELLALEISDETIPVLLIVAGIAYPVFGPTYHVFGPVYQIFGPVDGSLFFELFILFLVPTCNAIT